MRAWLGAWGADLDDDTLACAVAAAGLPRGVVSPREPLVGEGLTWFWHWPRFASTVEPSVLAAMWRHDAERRGALRIAIARVTEPAPGLAYAVQRLLNRPAVVGQGAVHVALMPTANVPRLTWPLDLVALPGPAGDRVPAAFGQTPRRLGERHWRAELLIVDGGLAEAAAAIERCHPSTRVGAVVIFGGLPGDHAVTGALIDAIARRTHARAIMAFDGPLASRWSEVLMTFAGPRALDLALGPPFGRVVLAGDRFPVVVETTARGGGLEHFSWKGLPPKPGAGPDDESPPRHLRVGVARPGGRRLVRAIERARAYEVQVSVGARRADLLSLIPEVPGLPRSAHRERLAVMFTDPVLAPAPRVAWIELPPVGDSDACVFRVETTATTERLEARIALLHDGRVLQTGVLRGVCDGASPITFDVDVAARAQLDGFDARRHFGATLIANHGDGGVAGFVAATAEGHAARLRVSDGDVKALLDGLSTAFDIIKDDPRPQRSLRDPSSVETLRDLAQHGRMFFERLIDDNDVGAALQTGDPIQVVSARKGAFLPVELTYRYPMPAMDADLCPHAEAGLAAGACPATCGGGTIARLCPLGFWSLSRVIERVQYRRDELGGEGDYGLSVEPLRDRARLEKPAAAVFGASARATRRVAGAVDDLATRLGATFGVTRVEPATTWATWAAQVKAAAAWPAMLVLVPHHEQKQGFQILEIGVDELRSAHLDIAHVLGDDARRAQPPIVLLLGCETQLSAISHESFVQRFRKHGAAVVVGTIATVLGLDAAPVAAELADAIMAEFGATPPRSLGDVMLRVRRRLVAAGRVMVLSLSADGDADWELA